MILILLLLWVLIFTIACGVSENSDVDINLDENIEQQEQEDPVHFNDEMENSENQTGLKPNEAGQVMVLMYHRFGDTEGTWQRTWENFRRDLETLYEEGYRLISIKDYLNNTIDLPAGYSPVILTFDDGYSNQFSVVKDGDEWQLNMQTAVGIMYEFYLENPDFGLEGIFYVNSQPFNGGNWEEAVKFLVNELGMDIGNHTRTHINLSKNTPERIQQEVGGLVKDFKEVLPDYEVDSLALPFGANPPQGVSLSGEYDGIKYENRGVLLVGANPAPAPIAKKYNPLKIPRIRADEENLYKWLNYFKENPHLRYVSDGDPDIIKVPSDMVESISEEALKDSRVKVYDRDLENIN